MNLTKSVYERTMKFLESTPKSERKKIGQFFTPEQIAKYMATLSKIKSDHISVLDPGAGSGILSAAIVENLVSSETKIIDIDLYENNIEVIPLLVQNLEEIKREVAKQEVVLTYNIIEDNFIVANEYSWLRLFPNQKYDIVISNPPYKKIAKNAIEARLMNEIVSGQPNLYFLFMSMGSHLLKEKGELIYIIPRSFSSGLYFTAFRRQFLDHMRITDLHLFTSRVTISGKNDEILQETLILRAVKTREIIDSIRVTESTGETCTDPINSFSINYATAVKQDKNSFLFFPVCKEDVKILEFIDRWPANLTKLGFRMKTGLVVDFREKEWLCTKKIDNTIPLLWAYNFQNQRVRFPVNVEGKPQYLFYSRETKRLQMDKGNYIILKRFTSKEEKRRLQCSLLFEEDFPEYEKISTENHLNFVTKIQGNMTLEELFGLFTILNSEYLDRYFRILNGSTQVNANEINSIPFPHLEDIRQLGKKAMSIVDLNAVECNTLLENQFLNPLDNKLD